MVGSKALELVQDSKATIFLVLELARGGELFDRIKVGECKQSRMRPWLWLGYGMEEAPMAT